MEKQIILEGRQLSTGYGHGGRSVTVHEGLDFTLWNGELTCLLGCNGAGKSTLLRTLAAVQLPLSGSLQLMGRPLEDYTARERSKTIGVVLTDRTQTGGLSVYELVALGRQPHTGFFGRLSRYDKELVAHAIEAVGMTAKTHSYVAELSDGERQKTMIAKALVQECPLILLDEPTAFLDVVSRIEVMELLRRLAVEEHKAILLSTHDIEQALALADRLWLMTQERRMVCGVTEDLVLSDAMNTLFDSASVGFDASRGTYLSDLERGRPVAVQTEDETLRYWVRNALARHGFCCVSETNGKDVPVLTVRSSREIIWRTSGHVQTFSSFEELLKGLCG